MASTRVLYELVGVDRASPAFRRAGASASGFERTMSRVGRAVALAGEATAAAAAVIGYESVKAATNFQSSMEKIRTQAGASQKDVRLLSAEVLRLGKYAQQSPQELADSLFHLKSVGLDNVKAMKALRAASDLAAVGGANLEDTTNAIAGAWRSGIKGAANFGQAAATVNAIIGAGNMRMEDFIGAIGTGFLPSARSFGLSLKSVGAALALMTDEGIPATAAATRLRMSFSLLAAPSGAAADQLKTIGVTGLQLANAMRSPGGLVAAIGLLKSHLDASGLSASKQAILLSHAFGGGRSSSAILTLVNNFETLRRKQDQVNNSLGRFGPAVQAQRKTAQAQFALLKSSLDVLAVRLGSALLPPVVKFTRFLGSTALPAATGFGHTVGRVFREIIPVKDIERDWHRLMLFLGLAKPPKPKPVTVSPGDIFHMGPGRLPTPAQVPGRQAFAYRDKLQRMLTEALPAPQTIADRFGAALSKVDWGKVTGDAIKAGAAGAQQIGAALVTLMGKVNWTQLGKQAAFALIPFVVGLVNNLANAIISEAIHHPLDMLVLITSLIPIGRVAGIVGKVFGEVRLIGPLVKMFAGPLEKAGGLVEKALGKMLGFVFRPVKDLISGYFHGADIWLSRQGDRIINGLLGGLRKIWGEAVAPWLGRTYVRVLSPFQDAGIWLTEKGKAIISGLFSGLRALWRSGPGPWFQSIRGWVGGVFRSGAEWLVNGGKAIISGLWSGMTFVWKKVSSWIGKIGGWIKNLKGPISADRGLLYDEGKAIMHGLLRGLGFGSKGVLGFVSGLGGKLAGAVSASGSALLGRAMAARMGWRGAQWNALYSLWQGESGWNRLARNPSSGAYGIPQALPASKMGAAANPPTSSAAAQIAWGLRYIQAVYGSPLRAYSMWLSRSPHWYAKGTAGAKRGWAWVGEKGRELVHFRGGETVLDHTSSKRLAGYATGTVSMSSRLSVIGRWLRGNLTTTAAIRHAMEATLKLIRQLYHGAAREWRARAVERASARMERLAGRYATVTRRLAAARGFASQTRSSLRDFASLGNVALPAQHAIQGRVFTTGSLAAGLAAKLNRLRKFGAAIRRLAHMHLSRALLRQIIDMGPDEGLDYARAILSGGGGLIRSLNQTEAAIGRTTRRISRTAADVVYDRGKAAGKGFLTGLMAEKRHLEYLMRHLARVLGRELASWLNIPVRRLRGYQAGAMFVPATGPAFLHRGEMVLPAQAADAARAALAGAGPPTQISVRVFLGTRELTDLVRVEISENDRRGARAARAGAGLAA